MVIEVTNMRRCSGKANKLSFTNTIRGTSKDIAIKEREIDYIKIKIIPFIIYFFVKTLPLLIDKCKSKNAASVSE